MDQRILIVNATTTVRVDWQCFSRQDQSVRMGGSEGSVTVRLLTEEKNTRGIVPLRVVIPRRIRRTG